MEKLSVRKQVSKTIVVFSGGLDSTVTLKEAVNHSKLPVEALTFDYGQRHQKEVAAAIEIAATLKVPSITVPLRNAFTYSALTVSYMDVPLVEYADSNIAQTEVVGRNMLFASLAVARAGKGGQVWLGVHGGDHALYPDCKPDFWEPFQALVLQTYGVEIVTPFLHKTKADIVNHGSAIDAPMDLSWSCYLGGAEHCGECGTCRERAEAFKLAGVQDNTKYLSTAGTV